MRKILLTNPIFKMVKMSNHFTSFRPFKICYYLQSKFPSKNITHGFWKNWWILIQTLRLISHFWKRFWSIKKYLAFLNYFIIINSFQTFGTKLNYFTIFLLNSAKDRQCKWNSCETQHKNNQNAFINQSYVSRYKAHGHDMISIQMLKLCGESILLPFSNPVLKVVLFPLNEKKQT